MLKRANPQLRKAILMKSDPELIKTIAEISQNILNGNLTLSKKSKASLQKHKSLLRKLGAPKISVKKRRNLICKNQVGGFLPLLLEPVLSTIVAHLIEKYG